jgi:phosphatidylglycerophosphatase A
MTALTRAAYLIATWGGLGWLRPAPGTWGSLGAVPLHLALSHLHPTLHAASVVGLCALGTWAAQVVALDRKSKDPQFVVIDEVIGTLLAMGAVRAQSWWLQVIALLLFRALDITKPGLIKKAERAKPVGLGIMLDDVVAGLLAGALASALGWFLPTLG